MDFKLKTFSIEIILPILLAVVFGISPMPVVWRWVGWFVSFGLLVFILLLHILFPSWIRLRVKFLFWVFLLILFVKITLPFAFAQWLLEKASIMSGELEVDPSSVPNSKPWVQFGPDADGMKAKLDLPNGSSWLSVWGDQFFVRREHGKIFVTTHVRDRNGSSVVVDIVDNKWTVSSLQNISWDKNYTKNALEVKDGRDRVVFQIILLPDVVRIQGEWWTEDKRGLRVVRPYPFDRVHVGPVWVVSQPAIPYRSEAHIEPIFKYPSKEHWGEFVDWFMLQP